MKKKRFFLLFLLAALVIIGLVQLQATLNLILPTNTVTKWVVRVLEKELSLQTSIKDVRLILFPRPAVRILTLVLSEPETGLEWVRAESLKVNLKLLPLFKGEVFPDEVVLKRPVIQVLRDSQGEWRFMPLASATPKGTVSVQAAPLPSFTIQSVILKDASISVIDQRTPSAKPHLVLLDTDVYIEGLEPDNPTRLRIKGRFPGKLLELNSFTVKGEITLPPGPLDLQRIEAKADILISNMPVEVSRPYLKEFFDLQLFAGKIDLQAACTLRPEGELGLSGRAALNNYLFLLPRYAAKPIPGEELHLNYSLTRSQAMVHVKHLDFRLGDSSIWGHGLWVPDVQGKPWYGLSLHAVNLSYQGIRNHIPDKLLPEGIARSLRDAVSSGTLDIPLFEITGGGQAPRLEEGRLSLKLAFHDFDLEMGPEFLPVKLLNGEIAITPEAIRFAHLNGSYGGTLIRDIDGLLPRSGLAGTDLDVDARLNLKEIQALVLTFPESLQNRFLLSYLRGAKGYANGKIHLASQERGEEPFALKGSVFMIGAGFSFPFAPFEISGIYGRLSIDGNHVLPFNLKAKIDKVPTSIDGEMRRLFSADSELVLNLSAAPTQEALIKWFPPLEGVLEISGENPALTLLLNGTPREMKVEALLDLTRTGLSIADWMRKPKGVINRLGFTGHVRGGKEMVIKKGSCEFAGEALSFSGRIQDKEKVSADIKIWSPRLSQGPLEQVFPALAGSSPESFLSVDLAVTYTPRKQRSLTTDGTLLMNSVGIHPSFSRSPIRKITGTVSFSGKEATSKGITCEWGEQLFSFDLNIPSIDAPEPELRISSPSLDFQTWVKEVKFFEEEPPRQQEATRKQRRFKTALNLRRITYGRLELQDFRADATMQEDHVMVSSFTTSGLGGTGTGTVRVDFSGRQPPFFQAQGILADVSAEEYLQLFPYNRTFYGGKITGSIRVEGDLFPEISETARQMTGDAHLLIDSRQDRSYLNNLLQEFFSGVEIMIGKKDERFLIIGYDKMGGDFTIHDGKFHSTNFYINQYHKFNVSGLTLGKLTAAVPIRIKHNVKAAGSFDFMDIYIDCYLAAQPFSIATKILKKVPLAGKILTGEDESLYSIYFRYKGNTGHKRRGTKEAARLERVVFQDLPETFKKVLKESH